MHGDFSLTGEKFRIFISPRIQEKAQVDFLLVQILLFYLYQNVK